MCTIMQVKSWLEQEIQAGNDFDEVIPGTLYTHEDLLSGASVDELDQEVVEELVAKYNK